MRVVNDVSVRLESVSAISGLSPRWVSGYAGIVLSMRKKYSEANTEKYSKEFRSSLKLIRRGNKQKMELCERSFFSSV